jgi:hypothetical protein
MKPEWNDLDTFLADNLKPFRPYAYFDKHLDCVRVKLLDCSVTEERKNRFVTVLKPNHGAGSGGNVGFMIKGIAHICNEAKIPLGAALTLIQVLDALIRCFPDAASKGVVEEFMPWIREKNIEVNFADA